MTGRKHNPARRRLLLNAAGTAAAAIAAAAQPQPSKVTSNKRVVVTIGNSGMGRAIAQAFVASGARVLVGDVGGEPLPEVLYRDTDVHAASFVSGCVLTVDGAFLAA